MKNMYAVRQTGHIIPLDYDYSFFSSDSKSNYSIKMEDEVARLILVSPDSLETEWQKTIEQNKNLWQPVIDDLDAAFFTK